MHGYNTRFEEAVYRFAQITHDSGAPVLPVLFTWPSRGRLFDYVYDRESATYSRDGLEAVLQALVKDPNVDSISILAHSMGNFVAVEALRQMAIRDRKLSPKIKDIMLAAPDLDFDVFRREIAEIEASDKDPPVTLFVSQDDYALAASRQLAGDEPRLGAIDPNAEPYRSELEKARVNVIDLSKVQSDDELNHGKFATQRSRAGDRPAPRRRPDLDRRQADARRTPRRRRARSGRRRWARRRRWRFPRPPRSSIPTRATPCRTRRARWARAPWTSCDRRRRRSRSKPARPWRLEQSRQSTASDDQQRRRITLL